jgi:hypothetical protein
MHRRHANALGRRYPAEFNSGQCRYFRFECRQVVAGKLIEMAVSGGAREYRHEFDSSRQKACEPFGGNVDGKPSA